ncbi:flavin reductase family protein [Psychroflexus aestuariivivens]|uniref:flavin reductase family protein n=1 Tax=Psychroflexus aestuariivivens TaxID=1795040 RepID=UPI000FDAF84B|nr:flavin reductase [Psychroflexus aestuariivivens]
MKHITKKEILDMPRLERMHLINSCGGVKSANLIGTISNQDISNLAVFNSVIHLGSNPPMLCFMLRPITVARHTYDNMKSTGEFTVNHIHQDFIQQAHQTSAKYNENESEFEAVNLDTYFLPEFKAPFVKFSAIQIGCRFVNEYHIKEQNCHLIIGEIEHLRFEDNLQHKDGWLDLSKAKTAGIIGLDGYVATELLDRFAYARPNENS